MYRGPSEDRRLEYAFRSGFGYPFCYLLRWRQDYENDDYHYTKTLDNTIDYIVHCFLIALSPLCLGTGKE